MRGIWNNRWLKTISLTYCWPSMIQYHQSQSFVLKTIFVADILQFIVSGLIWDMSNVTHFLHHDKMWHYDCQVWGVVHLLPVGEDHSQRDHIILIYSPSVNHTMNWMRMSDIKSLTSCWSWCRIRISRNILMHCSQTIGCKTRSGHIYD